MVDLKELKKLVKYLRKEGITEFKSGDLEFKLGPKEKPIRRTKQDVTQTIHDAIESDLPSKLELMFPTATPEELEEIAEDFNA